MDASQFQAYFETLNLDATLDATQTIRASGSSSGSTVAYGGLPSVDLGRSTNPEFELGDTIGEGGMGVVRAARQIALHREVAVKTLREERKDESSRDGVLHEALIMGGLEHPNVVPVYTLGQTADGAPVIVMKRIEGVPWLTTLTDPTAIPDLAPAEDALAWHLEVFSSVCQAVHFAHSRGVLHRDIKPENVMIGAFGEVYLVDWGVAVTTDDEKAEFLVHAREVNSVSGTPSYMAPEMTTAQGDSLGVHTDVYLLGATLYHVLTGQVPHSGNSLFEIMFKAYESAPVPSAEDVPEGVLDICRVAMSKEPSDRFGSAEQMRRAVLDFERHRASISLSEETLARLRTLRTIVEAADSADEAEFRGVAGQCRFGFEQALRVWAGNEAAQDGLRRTLRLMVRWELAQENVRSAEALLAELGRDDELATKLEALRSRIAQHDQEVEELRQLRGETSLEQGASERAVGAVIALLAWTAMPFLTAYLHKSLGMRLDPAMFVLHSATISGPMVLLAVVLWLRKTFNQANRRITRFLLAFAVWLPLYRAVSTMLLELDVVHAVALENLVYAVIYAGIAILSDRLAVVGMVTFCLSGLIGAAWPQYVFEATGAANFIAIGWLGYAWASQRQTVPN